MRLRSGPSAPDVFRHVVRDLIYPGLRELGFRGGGTTGFWYGQGVYTGDVEIRASVPGPPGTVDFGVYLSAQHTPTGTRFWSASLDELIPGRLGQRWAVQAGRSGRPVAASVLGGLREQGWPAIQAALEAPGYPVDPRARWARTFPPRPGAGERPSLPPGLAGLAEVLVPSGSAADQWFAGLADRDEAARCSAVDRIGTEAAGDPRALPVLLDRLQHDPSDRVRWQAARALRPSAGSAEVRAALTAAGAEDEDIQVRWAARYALRLAAAVPG
jgi:HEAT repeats